MVMGGARCAVDRHLTGYLPFQPITGLVAGVDVVARLVLGRILESSPWAVYAVKGASVSSSYNSIAR